MICVCGALLDSYECRLRAHLAGPVRDYGLEAQQKAEAHLAQCWEALDAEETEEAVVWPETAAPFCGCETCVIREVLFIAWPIFHEAAMSGVPA